MTLVIRYRQEARNMKTDAELIRRKYSAINNMVYYIKNTARCYPMLFFWCGLSVVLNIALPLLTTFFPKVVIEAITEKNDILYLITITLTFTLPIAMITGIKKFTEQYVYRHRFKMNSFYLRMVANKGMTTDYPNQENERFRKLQSESFNCCNGHYSPLTQVYDVLITLISGILGFTVYFGILAKLDIIVVVCYRYEGSDADTLHNINLIINPAEHLAVVGLNGAGKTTLVKLICGLTDPTVVEVLYDGINVRKYNRVEFYELFSAVFQQFSIMPVKIENIVSESLSENTDRGRVERCLVKAGLYSKIKSLPNGINSEYGKTIFDDGIELSGGEIQKLLLARALYKNAPVMLLDEPTAALDPIAESALYENYNEIMRNKSAVFISHRLASTRFCGRILLLENGAITEEGTHDSLIASKGKYYELFETQAKYYRDSPDGEEVAF